MSKLGRVSVIETATTNTGFSEPLTSNFETTRLQAARIAGIIRNNGNGSVATTVSEEPTSKYEVRRIKVLSALRKA